MIAYLRGTLSALREDAALLDVGGVGYEVMIPPLVRDSLASHPTDGELTLVTHDYLSIEQSRATPFLVGFLTEVQREFFLLLSSVLGPRTGLRAMAAPIDRIAQAIELGDGRFLKNLPGIGTQKAKELVARLQGKVGPFLGAETEEGAGWVAPAPATGPAAEAIDALIALGLKYGEASQRVAAALRDHADLDSVEQILQAVFLARARSQ